MADKIISWLTRHWRTLGALAILSIGFWLVYSYGFVKVEVVSETNGEISYEIFTQTSNSKFSTNNDKKTLKKLVRRGTQEVTVTHSQGTFLGVVQSGGFFGTTTVQAELKTPKAREVVGNNPGACMFSHNGVLYSYECQPTITLTQHTPATAEVPGKVRNVASPVGLINGSVYTTQGLVLIGREPAAAGTAANNYKGFTLGTGLVVASSSELKGLDNGESYRYQAYLDGFLAYNRDFSKAFYYSDITADPVDLSQQAPDGKDYRFAAAQSGNGSLVLLYVEGQNYDLSSEEVKKAEGGTSIIRIVSEDRQTKDLELGYIVNDALMCGDNLLCVLRRSDKTMLVFDVAGSKEAHLYSVRNIDQIRNFPGGFTIQRSSSIYSFNPQAKQGFVEFSYGSQQFCGIDPGGQGYFVCMKDNKDQNMVVYVDQTKDDTTNQAEQKFLELEYLAQVRSLTMYKDIVYITLNIRDDAYDPATRTFGYDETEKKAAKDFLNSEIDRLGINRDKFKIIILPL